MNLSTSDETNQKAETAENAKKKRSVPAQVFAFFASWGLACVLLTFLLLLTFIGTLEQVNLGLYEAGNKYFESLFLVHKFGPVPVILPGVYLLMVLLFINLVCGALIRARKSWRAPGMLIAHCGILFMLVAGLVSFHFTQEGNLVLSERSKLGVEFEDVEGEARVVSVEPDEEGARAGVEAGDVLLAVVRPGEDAKLSTEDDELLTISDYRAEQRLLAAEQFTTGVAGEKKLLKVRRGEEEKDLEVTYHGEVGNEYYNLVNWSIEVGEYTGDALPERVMVISPEELKPLEKKGAKRVFFSSQLPFEIEVSNYLRNCEPRPVGGAKAASNAVGGFYLSELEPERQAEQNFPGARVRILPSGGGAPIEDSLLIGEYPGAGNTAPLTVELDGKRWAVSLTKQRFGLPFKIQLEKFTKLEHPGTTKPMEFKSSVTKLNPDGTEETSLIWMNNPLRSSGYTVYQAGWGPPDAKKGDPLYTNLAVALNPADQWPKWACYVVAVGLVIHFTQKLFKSLNRTQRKRLREQAAAKNPAK